MLSVTVVVTQPPDTGEKGKRKKTKSSRRFTDVHPNTYTHTYKATHALSLFAFVVVIVVSSLNVVVAVVVVAATIPRLTLI